MNITTIDREHHFYVTCTTSGTWLVHEHGQRPVEGVAVHQYANGLLRYEAHKGLYCGHVGLVLDYMKEHPEEAMA